MIASLRATHLTPVSAILVVLLVFVISLGLRLDMFKEYSAAPGVEATYHLLWTAKALAESDASAHFYLPTVTLVPETGNPITWGATVPTRGGAYVYTSFPPLGFLVPAAALQAIDSSSFLALGFMNSLVGLTAALALAGLARAMVLQIATVDEDRGPEAFRRKGWIVFLLCAVSYLLLKEVLVSHGPTVWPHSLSQIALIAGCWLALRIFTRRASVGTTLGVVLVALLYPSLEWTGYVFNAGLALALIYDGLRRQGGKLALGAAVGVVLATLAAGALLLVHFSIAVGMEPLMEALGRRAAARGFNELALLGLPVSYFASFGALLPIGVLGLWWILSASREQVPAAFWLLLFTATFPMLENVVMMQHAYQFSFDRLKLAVPLFLVCAIVLWQARLPERNPMVVVGLIAAVVWSNVQTFGHDVVYYKSWGRIHAANTRLSDQLAQTSHENCVLFGTNGAVRGYMNLTFGRDIFERTTPEELLRRNMELAQRGCNLVFVQTVPSPFSDLPEFAVISVYDANGAQLRRYEAY